MQYNNAYPHGHDTRQPYPSPAGHHARPPPNHHLGYAEQSNSHQVSPYPTTNALMQGEYIEPHMNQALQYSSYPPQGPAVLRDDHRSYFASQGSSLENFPSSHSPTHSYLPGTVDPQSPRNTSRPPQQFISTPSQAYHQNYSHSPSTASQGPTQRRPSMDPYYHMSPNPQHLSHAATHGGRSSSGTHPGSQHSHSQSHSSSASGERYPCDLCERTFTRSHDRRRHYETVHAATPVLHKCRYCQKDFSRADSLKRHVDNGCDEMPSHR